MDPHSKAHAGIYALMHYRLMQLVETLSDEEKAQLRAELQAENTTKGSDMDDKIREAIAEVVQYNWADERRDFEQMQFENEDKPEGEWHIFQRLVTLDNFLNGTSHTAEDHIEILD